MFDRTYAALARLRGLGMRVDEELVRLAAVLHDTGAVLHPGNSSNPGAGARRA